MGSDSRWSVKGLEWGNHVNEIVITLDVDWAPDFMIDAVAEMLSEAHIGATWFVTHSSPAIERLRQHPDTFELGIHPNFLPNSTQGSTPRNVLRHCMEIVPEATAMRTHGLVQSGLLLDTVLEKTAIRVDVSLFLPRMSHITPIGYQRGGNTLIRVPFFWEDRYEMEIPRPSWNLCEELLVPGLKVFSFHPVHVYLNSSLSSYNLLSRTTRLPDLSENDIARYMGRGDGPRTLFDEMIEYLGRTGRSRRIRDVTQDSASEEKNEETARAPLLRTIHRS